MRIKKIKTHCPKGHPFTQENSFFRKDGFIACRECMNQYSRLWWKNNCSRVLAKKVKYYRNRYRTNPEFRKRIIASSYKSRVKYPEKARARGILKWRIEKGEIIRLACEICGNPKSQAHHEDYSKPLEVKWLCAKHHMGRHKELRDLLKQPPKETL